MKIRSTRESAVQGKQPHNILQTETLKGMGQDTHTQINRERKTRHEADLIH